MWPAETEVMVSQLWFMCGSHFLISVQGAVCLTNRLYWNLASLEPKVRSRSRWVLESEKNVICKNLIKIKEIKIARLKIYTIFSLWVSQNFILLKQKSMPLIMKFGNSKLVQSDCIYPCGKTNASVSYFLSNIDIGLLKYKKKTKQTMILIYWREWWLHK